MKPITATVFLTFAAAAKAFEPCGQYPTRITALDNSTCLPPFYMGKIEGYAPDKVPGQNCSSTVEVMLNCTCHNGDLVYNRRYCYYGITGTEDDNTGNVTVGLCGGGRCHLHEYKTHIEVDLRDMQLAHILKAFPKPPCIAVNMSVTPELKAVAGCEFFCYRRDNKDINDGRPCVLEWYGKRFTGRPVVTLTGSCWNGICKPAEPYSSTFVGVCHDYDRYKRNTKVVEKCTYTCDGKAQRNRADGLTCLFHKTNFLSRDELGVCQAGACSKVRQADGCEVLHWPYRKTSPVSLAKECVCKSGRKITSLPDGVLCVMRRVLSWTGMKVQEVGVCSKGRCTAHPPDRPQPHEFKKKECQIANVQVTSELIVAAGCMATCRRYETERRPDGTLCLLEYKRQEKPIGPSTKTYTIGVCFSGRCVRTKNSWDIKL